MSTHAAASRRGNRRRGLTVIELIIVLAVVIILAAILYPVFGRLREPRGHHSCTSNLKQIGLAMAQYTADFDSKYPRLIVGWTQAPPPSNEISWRSVLSSYAKNEEFWKCPSNHTLNEHLSPYDNLTLSYDVVDCGPIRRNRSTVQADVKAPASTILIFEENGFNPQSQENGVLWDTDDGNENWTNILFAGHLGASNYLFADGHVKSLAPMKTIVGGKNQWHLNVRDAVSPRALEKLKAANRNFK